MERTYDYFTINPLTGEVSLARELDSNAYKSYELQISATDGGTPSLRGSSTVSLALLCSSTGECPQQSQSLYGRVYIVYLVEVPYCCLHRCCCRHWRWSWRHVVHTLSDYYCGCCEKEEALKQNCCCHYGDGRESGTSRRGI